MFNLKSGLMDERHNLIFLKSTMTPLQPYDGIAPMRLGNDEMQPPPPFKKVAQLSKSK